MFAQMSRFPVVCAGITALLSMVGSSPAFSSDATAQQQIVDKAQLTLEAFASDGQLKDAFKQLSKEGESALHHSAVHAGGLHLRRRRRQRRVDCAG